MLPIAPCMKSIPSIPSSMSPCRRRRRLEHGASARHRELQAHPAMRSKSSVAHRADQGSHFTAEVEATSPLRFPPLRRALPRARALRTPAESSGAPPPRGAPGQRPPRLPARPLARGARARALARGRGRGRTVVEVGGKHEDRAAAVDGAPVVLDLAALKRVLQRVQLRAGGRSARASRRGRDESGGVERVRGVVARLRG